MVSRETSIFSRQVQKLMDEESYRLLQLRLVQDPAAGVLIKGTGGGRSAGWDQDEESEAVSA